MPVTRLPADNTQRGVILYTSGGFAHEAPFRFQLSVSIADVAATLNNIIAAMLPLMANADAVEGAHWIAAGSGVSVPLVVDTGNGTAGAIEPTDRDRCAFISITGKDAYGHKVTSKFFSVKFEAAGQFRGPLSGASPAVTAWYNSIAHSAPAVVSTIYPETPFWNGYINNAYNAYYQRKQR